MRLFLMSLVVGLCAVATAHAQSGEDAIIMIPSFTAPSDDTVDPLTEADPEVAMQSGLARLSRQRSADVTVDERGPDIAPLLSHRAGANPGRTLRLQGENPYATFSIFLPREAVPGNLRILHMSGVDVLPERSIMEITVNDRVIGSAPLGNFDPEAEELFPVPGDIWRPGTNEVKIRLEQTHRLFCGPEAAFDLWTDIDLTRSGAVLESRPLDPGAVDFLAGMAHDAGSGLSIALRDPEGLSPKAQPMLDGLARAFTELLRGRVLTYEDSPPWGMAPAATLDRSKLPPRMARITLIPTLGPAGAEYRRGGDGALVLVIAVPPDGIDAAAAKALLDGALSDVSTAAFARDADAVQKGIDPRTRMAAGEPVTLDSIGMGTTRTVSHYFRRDQVFTLPRDWLVLTAQKAILHLDYIYARGLPEKSMLLIRINGETVRLLPLVEDGGELIEQFPIKFYANLLKEGPNLLQFEALIPGASEDMACPEARFPKLEIRGTSTLTVPPSPKLRLNGLRLPVYALRGGNITLNGAPLDSLPAADRMTVVATLGEPSTYASRLTAVTADQVTGLPMGDYDLAPDAIAQVVSRAPEIAPLAMPSVDKIGELPEDLFGAPPGVALDPKPFLGSIVSGWGARADGLRNRIGSIRDRILPDADAEAKAWLDRQSGRAVLVQLDDSDPRSIHLILGRDVPLTEVAASISAARRTIGGPHGQLSVLGDDGLWRSWADSRRLPVLREPLTLRNARQVMGNYASWSPVAFTALLFFLALLAAMVALRLVVMTRGEK
ncbi:cellulose synthase regulator protein [Rhodobacteraceae bacterium THAF1]|uniref:cellulose biosynthesis cyclic di-GMP-binding regulatory protein BcsB n=1 Tax=Palleronia sp. THAF1 TaxID=2587842 RepID=UPI000F3B4A02|nr:cellulose biosynthesis cyclic di-GMP-binding regulatory protein BcsB [Palleronia sp. THAF1]QFU09779.1 cellulose synthase regulator protein [Palleronia sp. THAF1]VDC17318.1 cellulose synthase regulator protein [Rhodobacteraceae bacterium THAF1]